MKSKIKNFIIGFNLIICSVIIVGSIYYFNYYSSQDFESILYAFTIGTEKTSPNVVINIILSCIIPFSITLIILILPIIKKVKNKLYLELSVRKRKFKLQLYPIKATSNHRIIYIFLIYIISICMFIKCFGVDEYIKNRIQDTKIFEQYYVDGRNVAIKFPEQKRNLIIIIGESFENTILSKQNGGLWEYSLMPELEQLALENTSFSNTNKLGGATQIHGTSFSAAGNVAITSGIPLKTTELLNYNNNYQGSGNYLSGVYSLRRNITK